MCRVEGRIRRGVGGVRDVGGRNEQQLTKKKNALIIKGGRSLTVERRTSICSSRALGVLLAERDGIGAKDTMRGLNFRARSASAQRNLSLYGVRTTDD